MSREPSPAIGTDIGQYRIEAVLGRGGMGVVYRATDARLGRKVALKVLPPEYGDDQTFRARFLRESRLAASIDHPGVVPIYEAGDAGGQLYIAMRHVDGIDLAELLRREGVLEPARALALTGQLAAALDAAHARGLVHRDVKPSNALVAREGDSEHVYLSDFGLSKEVAGDATLSASGGFVGTVKYMAPEVIRSGQADARSDLYSLGCVLFECLTGAAPFPGPSEAAVIYGHLEEPPPRVSEQRAGLPRALDAVLARALHKDPDRRWATGAQLAQAARAALAGAAPSPMRRRRTLVAALGVLALVVAGVVARLWDSRDPPGLASVRANGIAVIEPGEAALTAQVALDGAPAAIAAGAGAVWVSDEDRDVVSRIDLESRTIRQTIPVGHGPGAVAVEERGVWVANRQDGTLSVISPQTNQVVDTVRVGRSVDGLCVNERGVWAASPTDFAVARFDPQTGRRAATVRLDAQPAQLACGTSEVWVSSPAAGTVTEISTAAAAAVRTVRVGRGAEALALGPSGLWITNSSEGTVSRIDRGRGAVTATVPVGVADGPSHLAVTRDDVWVSSEQAGTLARIDPAKATVVEKLSVGNRPQGIAAIGGALWVGVADTGARHRGGTLRLEYAVELGWRDFDPATAPSAESAEILGLVHDGLTAFRREAGPAGSIVVPNLADALPSPTDGGRTYAFRLRRGLRYSNGEPVRASDVRFSMERALRLTESPAPSLFAGVVGASRCRAGRCDLSRGVVTDDRAGTVVFRLREPDGDLLSKLAIAAVLPASVGNSAPAGRPLPATGPYVIDELRPGRSLRLKRNPRFVSWSAPVRPDGYPDVISIRLGVAGAEAVDRVLDGKSDRLNTYGTLAPERLPELRRRAPGQLRASTAPTTFMFLLNTTQPPFNDPDARRAVAFAFDRRAAAKAAGGADIARETCQVLPPSFPGSRPYCPFTVAGSGGAGGRPDLAQARRLVRRSGTRGQRVTVRGPDIANRAVLELMRDTLRRLGYDARLRVLPVDEHFGTLGDTRRKVQIGLMPWAAALPAPSYFLDLFSCDTLVRNTPENGNPSHFCDRETERLMDEAARLQAIDPAAADATWARAERRIVDQAPLVAAYNLIVTDLVSRRLGNYQFSPMIEMLIDQAWVR